MVWYQEINPGFIICESCRQDKRKKRFYEKYVSDNDSSVLVREVCAAKNCPHLYVRAYFCLEHALLYEKSQIEIRICNCCKRNVLELYHENLSPWFLLPMTDIHPTVHGLEKRVLDGSSIPLEKSIQHTRNGSKNGTEARLKRRSNRRLSVIRTQARKEAKEASLGLVPRANARFLWNENTSRKKLDMDTLPAVICRGRNPVSTSTTYPDPIGIFCNVKGCKFYAKTGDHCRFHSATPLEYKVATTKQ